MYRRAAAIFNFFNKIKNSKPLVQADRSYWQSLSQLTLNHGIYQIRTLCTENNRTNCTADIPTNNLIEKVNNLAREVAIITTTILMECNAQFFINTSKNSETWNSSFPSDCIIVYTDGGKRYNRCGAGVYFGGNHPKNRAFLLETVFDTGEAELIAVIMALQSLRSSPHYKYPKIMVRTDYLQLISGLKCKNGNRKHQQYMDAIKDLATHFPSGVLIQHVRGHNDDPGNEAANELARQGIMNNQTGRQFPRTKKEDSAKRSDQEINTREYIEKHSVFISNK